MLGTTIDQDGATTLNFVRDEKRKLVAQRRTASGSVTRQYPLFDQLGSTVALTDSTGAVAARYIYEDPFGDNPVTSGTASTPIRFAGGYRDSETGFYKFGERYYNATQGRWTQRDPLNQAFSPSEANLYSYAAQNPINLVDLNGMFYGRINGHEYISYNVLLHWMDYLPPFNAVGRVRVGNMAHAVHGLEDICL